MTVDEILEILDEILEILDETSLELRRRAVLTNDDVAEIKASAGAEVCEQIAALIRERR